VEYAFLDVLADFLEPGSGFNVVDFIKADGIYRSQGFQIDKDPLAAAGEVGSYFPD
jgi:hypothetical protein